MPPIEFEIIVDVTYRHKIRAVAPDASVAIDGIMAGFPNASDPLERKMPGELHVFSEVRACRALVPLTVQS